MQICAILHHSSKDLLAKLLANDVSMSLLGCWWDALIWQDTHSNANKGEVFEYKGTPWFIYHKDIKPDANHIVIDCGDDEDLFLWCINYPIDAYGWGYDIQGYGEQKKKRIEKEKEKHRKKLAEYFESLTPEQKAEIQRLNEMANKNVSKLRKFLEYDSIEIQGTNVKV